MVSKTQDNVERWLVHAEFKFKYATDPSTEMFKIMISSPDSYDEGTEVFEPRNQPGTIVIGKRRMLRSNANKRFFDMTPEEQNLVEQKISSYCDLLEAVHRFFIENGRKGVGVYIVLDPNRGYNQMDFLNSLERIIEMADRLAMYMKKTL